MESKLQFYKALFELHKDIEVMKKDEKNPFFNSSYVPLPKMLRTLKPTMSKHGFILTQPTEVRSQDGVFVNVVTSKITHAETGISESAELAITPGILDEVKKIKVNGEEKSYDTKGDMQKLCGGVTYGRRYTLSALLGLEESDDDGNAASGNVSSGKSVTKTTKSSTSSKSSFRRPKKTTEVTTGGEDW